MQTRRKPLLPIVLIALSVIPIIAGLARLAQIAGAPIELIHSARVLAAPRLVFVAHISGAIIFLTLGAFQFSSATGLANRRRHRNRGAIVAVAALVTGASAIWLTVFFPHAPHDGAVLNVIRLAAGSGISIAAILGICAARNRRIADHRKWMTRAYALGSATGIQAFVTAGWTVLVENPAGLTRAYIFAGCWIACLAFTELRLNTTTIQPLNGLRHDNSQ